MKKTGVGTIVKRSVITVLAAGGLIYYGGRCDFPHLGSNSGSEVKTSYNLENVTKQYTATEQDWSKLTSDEKVDFIKNEIGDELGRGYDSLQNSLDGLTKSICEQYYR